MGAISLATSAAGWFSHSFTPSQCTRLHLAPVITQLLATWGSLGLILLKTYTISRKSNGVLLTLSLIAIFCIPLQIFGTLYLRHSSVVDGHCISQVHTEWGEYDSGLLYFAANSTLSGVSFLFATGFIWSHTLRSPLTSVWKTLISHGVPFIATIAIANLLCVLASLNLPNIRNLGWTFPNAIILIMSQHLGLTNSELLYVFEEFDAPSMTRSARRKRGEYRRGQAEMAGITVPTHTAPRTSADDLEMEIRDSRTSQYVVSVGGRRHSSITEVDGRDLGVQRTSGKWFAETDADDEKEMDVESIVDVRRPNGREMQGSIAAPSTHAWTMRMHG
ncbi:hypothetical protein M407DRAFT_30120 [Tulasnella calospora MUT 4182]|uniref:Uncharacterized protein n=1 Tax=Tulasnella calospora MUT 4182 TaxID=1051891 RepID=A0A0C3PYA8_9AGAM|nr:hypothetical protein M407DRAFT_30120 [Tulasnella calospora MUT 4182]